MSEQGKRYTVKILLPAQYELEELGQLYLALSGTKSAHKITDSIYDAMEPLSRFPFSGSVVRDAELRAMGYRYVVVEKYVLIYRLIEETVVVYQIFDGRSDYPTLFRSELFK